MLEFKDKLDRLELRAGNSRNFTNRIRFILIIFLLPLAFHANIYGVARSTYIRRPRSLSVLWLHRVLQESFAAENTPT